LDQWLLSDRSSHSRDAGRPACRALLACNAPGANVVEAIQVARRLGPGDRVVTLPADSGLEYLNTDVDRSG
jgi:hypothetical protein